MENVLLFVHSHRNILVSNMMDYIDMVVSYPDLSAGITCGETIESAVANALDAKKT